jgi:hypothetical protein
MVSAPPPPESGRRFCCNRLRRIRLPSGVEAPAGWPLGCFLSGRMLDESPAHDRRPHRDAAGREGLRCSRQERYVVADYNWWTDLPEAEREALDILQLIPPVASGSGWKEAWSASPGGVRYPLGWTSDRGELDFGAGRPGLTKEDLTPQRRPGWTVTRMPGTTPHSRAEIVRRLTEERQPVRVVAQAFGNLGAHASEVGGARTTAPAWGIARAGRSRGALSNEAGAVRRIV